MNFYKHHIGDYDQATRHLSFVEDAAYCRLIRKYYADEGPLPNDLKKVQKLIAARTKEEKAAVETVLEEFFTLEEDGWHQKRCDEELEVARVKAERNRQVGKLGGRPKKVETQTEPTGNPDGYETETQTVSEKNPSQTPEARHQTPEKEKTKRVPALSSSDLMADGVAEATANEYLALRKQKRAPLTPTAWDGIKREAEKAGWALQDVVTKCLARGWQGFEAAWVTNGASNGQQGFDRHGNFGQQNYRAGVAADGSF